MFWCFMKIFTPSCLWLWMTNTLNPECGSFHGEKHKCRIKQTLLAVSRSEGLWLWFPNFGLDICLPFLSFYSFSHSPNPKSHSLSTPNLWWLMCTSDGGVHCALCRSRPTMFYNIPGWHTSTRLYALGCIPLEIIVGVLKPLYCVKSSTLVYLI